MPIRMPGNASGGTWRPDVINYPDSSISNEAFGGKQVTAPKLRKRFFRYVRFDSGVTITAKSVFVHIPRPSTNDTTVRAVRVVPLVAPTGGTRHFTVDLVNENGGVSYLAAPIVVSSENSNLEVISGFVVDTDIALGTNPAKIVVAVAGSTGTQGAGAIIQAVFEDKPA